MDSSTKPSRYKAGEITVFILRSDSKCSECQRELFPGNMLRLEKEQPLCLDCADLAHLEFLPSGDAALTRRASKHSALRAVVLKWSRTRQQYERQGLLLIPAAIRQAEEECLADADIRERRRSLEAERRAERDEEFISQFAARIREQFPGCPSAEADQIAAHACERASGRVGRSALAKQFELETIRLAVCAHIRHVHTSYDQLLGQMIDRSEARAAVRPQIESVRQRWEINDGETV